MSLAADLVPVLPAWLQRPLWSAVRPLVSWQLRRFAARRVGAAGDVQQEPVPPCELVAQTALLHASEAEVKSDRAYHLATGALTVLTWLRELERSGLDVRTLRSVLELGCGTGRLLRHLSVLPEVHLVGCDVDAACVAWCRENLPCMDIHRNALQPPLAFAEDGAFDLVLAQSVFTHVPLEWQAAWLGEVHRVLRPGGWLACNVLGRHHARVMLEDADRAELERVGHFTLGADDPRASHSTRLIGSWDVFQTRGAVRAAFGERFEIRHHGDGPLLDTLLLRRA